MGSVGIQKSIRWKRMCDDARESSFYEMDDWNVPLEEVLFTWPDLVSLGIIEL